LLSPYSFESQNHTDVQFSRNAIKAKIGLKHKGALNTKRMRTMNIWPGSGPDIQELDMRLSKEILFVFISLLSGVALISTVELIIGDEGQMVMIAKNFSAGATTTAVYLYIKWLERQSF
jgi:hypothetical protein